MTRRPFVTQKPVRESWNGRRWKTQHGRACDIFQGNPTRQVKFFLWLLDGNRNIYQGDFTTRREMERHMLGDTRNAR